MTGPLDAALALLVAAVLNLAVLSRLRQVYPGEEGRFLWRVYRWTLLLRYALALFLNASAQESTFAGMFWGDSSTYDWAGVSLAQSWSHDYVVNRHAPAWVSGYGFIYFVAVIYWFFGRNQLLVQLLNGTLGAITVIVLYAIAKLLFGEAAARWSARFMAFFPQIIFWSAAMYKDPAIMLCVALSMYAVLRLARAFSLGMVVLFLGAALSLMTLRFYVFYFVAFATLGTFVFGQRGRGLVGNVIATMVLVGTFFGAYSFAASKEVVEQHTSYFDLETLQRSRLDLARSARSGFGVEKDVSTMAGAIAAVPSGLVYLLFAPFPWAVSGLRQALTVPEMLVWYALMPAFVRGLVYGIRRRLRDCLPILVFTASLTVAYAVFQGNVGTAYRQRTQITMFFFVFMGVGLAQKQEAREAGWIRTSGLGPVPPR